MARTVGIASYPPVSFEMINELKQSYLLFDSVGFYSHSLVSSTQNHIIFLRESAQLRPELTGIANEVEYLFNHEFVEDLLKPNFSLEGKADSPAGAAIIKSLELQNAIDASIKTMKTHEELYHLGQQILASNARLTGLIVNNDGSDRTGVLLNDELQLPLESNPIRVDVLKLVVDQIPIPDSQTSWEKIREFKNNPDNKGRLASLKDWMNKAIKSGRTIAEINDEFDSLIYQYRKSLELHEIKHRSGTMQTLIEGSAELIENAFKLNFSKIAKGLFSAQTTKAELYSAELTAPGNALAYLYMAKKAFSK